MAEEFEIRCLLGLMQSENHAILKTTTKFNYIDASWEQMILTLHNNLRLISVIRVWL